ncbi:MAG: tetratricopeptide repeat protein [Deltaproteobacteria bacterium]|nr:tetratricopeptide repeat protein [Deltaproteobacteria bacterium]
MDETLKQQLILAREHYEKHEYDQALPALEAIVATSDRFADVHNMLGVIRYDRCDFAEARAHFAAAVECNPTYTEALINLAVTLNELGQFAESRAVRERLAERGVSTSPATPADIEPFARGKLANLHADLADAYGALGLLSHAAGEYRRALELCPTFADLHTRLGHVLRDAGLLDAAAQAYLQGIVVNPHYVPARVGLGVVQFSKGDRDAAERSWNEALTIAPNDRLASMYLRMSKGKRMTPSVQLRAVQPADAQTIAPDPAKEPQ